MELKNRKIILRDFIKSDIDDRIYWETVETEWQLWDAPWEYDEGEEVFNSEEYKKNCLARLDKNKSENSMRRGFQICINDENCKHIGWCNSYNIGTNYEYIKEQGYCTIGINIPDSSSRHKGYATASWDIFIQYLFDIGINEIYTQTWSGNERVLGLMRKIGFQECNRELNCRKVRGQFYDGLTFKLNMEKYKEFHLNFNVNC